MPTQERRTPAPAPDEEFSPEYLAMLVVCGGSVRDSDWSVLPEALASRRPPPEPGVDAPEPVPPPV